MADEDPFSEIAQIVREAPDVGRGVLALGALVRRHVPDHAPLWGVLRSLRWADDVPVVRDAWLDLLRRCVPADANGIYLGIDGLNMPNGKGIEVGCSRQYRPGSGNIDYMYGCDVYCDDLPLPSLASWYGWLYGTPGVATLKHEELLQVEYPMSLGCSALVLRDAFRQIDPGLMAGATGERCFAFGFHDGDMIRLGRATHDGFDCDATFDW